MPIINLTTIIEADIELVFDLSRSIEVHEKSTAKTNEKAITGKTSGLMNLNDTVTWRAKHFGIYQKLTVKITEFNKPESFTDEMVSGIFHGFKHTHKFTQEGNYTRMEDVFDYKSPLGILGKLADTIFLKKYMTMFLKERNKVIKKIAEQEITLSIK